MMARTLILSLVGLLTIVSPVYLIFVAISDQSQLYQYSALPRARTSANIGDTRQNVMDQALDILKLNSVATGLLKLPRVGQLAGNLTGSTVICSPLLVALVIGYLLFCFTDHAQLFHLAQIR